MKPIRMTATGALAEVRVAPAGRVARAVLDRDGATLRLGCYMEPAETREAIVRAIDDDAWRRRAIASMRTAIDETVNDALPFDRPRDFEGPDRDGELRAHWASAYYGGRHGFEVDGQSLPSGLADQMKRQRRRTWEGIMREAPKRSLLYGARPTRALFERLAAE